ncbi:ATP-binding cassette domain-containing protein [Desulfobacterales bacterium HSG17]|nr:ATP-binding cassette domain-containing protein [Desulfobacterales bacterium HSG17]
MKSEKSKEAAVLHLVKVSLSVGNQVIIDDLSVSIRSDEVVTVMGPSGAGKSSLLAFICGFLDPAFTRHGTIRLNQREITHCPPEKRRVGILFQDDLLFPHMTVAQNLAFALPQKQKNKHERQKAVAQALAEAGLDGFEKRMPDTLSGGQRARVAVMRTLLSEPEALLLDEPFSKLDADTRQRFRGFVFSHARQYSLPTLLVTHDPEDANVSGGRVIKLKENQGKEKQTEGF